MFLNSSLATLKLKLIPKRQVLVGRKCCFIQEAGNMGEKKDSCPRTNSEDSAGL